MHIGVLEDDPSQCELLLALLEDGQHTARGFGFAETFRDGIQRETFDLLLVDWNLPDGTGGEVIEWVRANVGWHLPVVVVTAEEEEQTVVDALKAGADDYIVKPPKPLELLARVNSALRRSRPNALEILRVGDYEVDIQRERLSVSGTPVTMTQKEFDLAVLLFQSIGKILSRDHLLDKVWGRSADVDTRTVDTHVSRLRRKLSLDGSRGWKLSPVYGFGYRFDRISN
ncbi:response regulator transcription factor [Variovorax sp. HJSM1_2]|uniref:response regulator transcription factor n=1 Tax=Variovorax sp. HJSM1_2 TaxID=3366263 RepID=UPI003BD2B11E